MKGVRKWVWSTKKAVNNEMERLATLVAENKTLYELLDFYSE